MKKINKTTEPRTLTEYRSSLQSENLNDTNIYDDFSTKTRDGCSNNEPDNLRKQLLEEQGYICCYCMSRIDCKKSKIEHFKSQSNNRDLQINYQNLFVACLGNEGKPQTDHYCDTKKGEDELNSVNLLDNIENSIKYKKNSNRQIEIYSDDAGINTECNDILNLNYEIIKRNRKETYDSVIKNLKQKKWKLSVIRKTINYYKQKHGDMFEPYCEMIVYFLTKKLISKGVTV